MKRMVKKMLKILCFVMITLILSGGCFVSSAEAGLSLEELQAKFPNGKYWNHTVGGTNNPDGWTNTPCTHHASMCYLSGTCGCNSFNGLGIQCNGFVRKLAYDAYGSSNFRTQWATTSVTNLKAGDIINYSDADTDPEYGHWVMVIARSGSTITVGEANYKNTCMIRWGATLNLNAIKVMYAYSAPYELPTSNDKDPVADVNSCIGGYNKIYLRGWTFDPDAPNEPVYLHVYVGGPAGSGAPFYTILANKARSDVNNVYGISGNHGFEDEISVSVLGQTTVYIYALNVTGTNNPQIGCYTVNIADDTDEPVISNVKVSNVSSEGYTVTCNVTDNVKVNRVQFPTWTAANNQDDLLGDWGTNAAASGSISGNTVTFKVNIASHNNEKGKYITHIYAYDDKGNYSTAAVEITVPESLAVSASINANNAHVGSKITITGIASGESGTYSYKYLAYNVATGKWSYLTSSYISSNTYTWTTTEIGNYLVYVEVKDSGTGKVLRSSAKTVTINYPELMVNANVSATNVAYGQNVTITGVAGGGSGSYAYKYLVYNTVAKTWSELTSSYVTNNTYAWTATSAGNYEVYVEVKDSGTGKVLRSSAKLVTVFYPAVTITASTNSPTIISGQKLTITGTATGGTGTYTYNYLIYNKDTEAWARLTPEFVTANTYTWTAGAAGEREIYVEVKDSNGTLVRSSAVNITVTHRPLTVAAQTSLAAVFTGSKVRITATADGGSGNYTYKYLIYNVETDTWANLTSGYIKDKSFVWTSGSIGKRQMYVEVKDSDGNVVRSSAVSLEVKPEPLKVSGQSSLSSVMQGNKIKITATVTGGVKGYTYSYLMHNMKTDQWSRLTSFGTGNTFTWTAGTPGAREIFVEVKDSTGTVVRSSAVKVEVTPQPLKVTGTSSLSAVMQGQNVRISAAVSGGVEGYTYSYLVHNMKTDEWARLTSFVSDKSFVWKAGSVGDREFFIEVKDSAGTVVRSSAVKIKVTPQPLKATVQSSQSTVKLGDKVKISASVSGGVEKYTYCYWIHNMDTNEWAKLTSGFVSQNSITWTAGSLAKREIYVEVRDAAGTLMKSNTICIEVTPLPLKVTGTSSLSAVMQGQNVRISAAVTGGVAGYTYSYLVHNMKTDEWARLTSFVSDKSFVWKAGSVGDREFFIEVKDSTGTVVRSSAVKVEVTPQPLKVTGSSSLTAVQKGNKVTLKATATGGAEGYTYSYLVHNMETDQWSRLTSFGTSSTFTWTAGSLGNREFFVEVKDSTGTVVRSSAIKVAVTPLPLTVALKSDVSTVAQGAKVNITVTAAGGTEKYTYYYQIRNMVNGTWGTLTSGFVSKNTFTWTAGSAGTREIYVDVKDSAGNVVKSSALVIVVK